VPPTRVPSWLTWEEACVRVVVELHRTEDDGVHGVVIADPEGTGEPYPFSGWLELLRLLEAFASPTAL
jgi:hypothetical protein